MSKTPSEQLRPNDRYIHRNRIGRWAVFLGYIALVVLLVGFGIRKVLNDVFGLDPVLGLLVGLAGVLVLLNFTLWRFFIRVDLVSAFVTVNLFVTFFSSKTEEKASSQDEASSSSLPTPEAFPRRNEEDRTLDRMTFPVYGPGTHICYPWEERNKEYNFSLQEVSADIGFTVLCTDGTVSVDGSYRLRPDFSDLIPFLSGVATSANELQDLITSYAFEVLSGKTVDEAIKSLPDLNTALMKKFGLNEGAGPTTEVSNFEERFGVFVGDVTIAHILPSKEVQRTRSSIAEAKAIADGTAVLLGFEDLKELEAAIASKTITNEVVSRARDRFMSASGNLEGMNLTRFEVDLAVSGLDPQTAKILAEGISRMGPAAVATLGNKSGNNPKKS